MEEDSRDRGENLLQNREKDRDRIVNKPLMTSLISLAVPAVGSSLFYIFFEMIDMFWVGKLGAASVAALSAANFFVWLLRALAQTVAAGALAMISRRTGENDSPRILETAVHALTGTLIFSAVVFTVFYPLTPVLVRLIRLEGTVSGQAALYIRVFLAGLIFLYLMVTAEHILRGMGNTRLPMIIVGVSLVLNGILDPLFIFTFGMGLKGAAYATILAQTAGCICMFIAIGHYFPEIRKAAPFLNRRFFNDYFLPMIRIGTPVSLSGAGFALIYIVLAGIISIFGTAPLAALGIGHRLESIPFFVALGFSMATAAMVGQNLGAGNPQKAKASVMFSLKIASGILLVCSFVFFFFPGPLYRIFISDPEVIAYGVRYLRIVAVFEVFLAFEVVLEGAFSGAGDTKPPFFVLFPLTLLRIPLGYALTRVSGLGVQGIWIAISVTTFLKGCILFLIFQKDAWMKKRV